MLNLGAIFPRKLVLVALLEAEIEKPQNYWEANGKDDIDENRPCHGNKVSPFVPKRLEVLDGGILLSEIEDHTKDFIRGVHVFLSKLTHVRVEYEHVARDCIRASKQHHVDCYLLSIQHAP
jgi:hypothetical protein